VLLALAGDVCCYIIVATKMVTTRVFHGIPLDFFEACSYNDRMAGKPREDRASVKGKTLRVRVTEEERKRLDEFAKGAGKDTSAWARDVLLAWRKKRRVGG
jgi:hypothetical protein